MLLQLLPVQATLKQQTPGSSKNWRLISRQTCLILSTTSHTRESWNLGQSEGVCVRRLGFHRRTYKQPCPHQGGATQEASARTPGEGSKAQRSCRFLGSRLVSFCDCVHHLLFSQKLIFSPNFSHNLWSICSLCAVALKMHSRPKAQN